MTEAVWDFRPKEHLLKEYDAGSSVLEKESALVRGVVSLLSELSSDPSDGVVLPMAAEAATDQNLATSAVDVLPMIQRAVEPLTPKQTDINASDTQRWTMNWKELGGYLKTRLEKQPLLADTLGEWFMEAGADMIETTYSPKELKKPLHVVVGGANDQCAFRPLLTLADMASTEFRIENGLVIQNEHTLNGEDEHAAGWLKDPEFVTTLREHIKARIKAGEIEPRLLVLGSAAAGRTFIDPAGNVVLGKERETETVSKYLHPEVGLLYPEQGLTEADAMLAGAIQVYGGDVNTIEVTDILSEDPARKPNKSVSFKSEFGRVELIATVGEDANLLRQVMIAGEQKPEFFEGIDAMLGATTAIYTWVQRPALREAATALGLKDIAVQALGISAHAAGMVRKPETLVGELTNYLKAMYGVAKRMLENAELNIQSDILNVGAAAL